MFLDIRNLALQESKSERPTETSSNGLGSESQAFEPNSLGTALIPRFGHDTLRRHIWLGSIYSDQQATNGTYVADSALEAKETDSSLSSAQDCPQCLYARF